MLDDILALAEKMKDDGVDVVTDFPPDAGTVALYSVGTNQSEHSRSFNVLLAWTGVTRRQWLLNKHTGIKRRSSADPTLFSPPIDILTPERSPSPMPAFCPLSL